MKVPKDVGRKILAMAGGAPRRAGGPRPPKKLPAGWAVELTLPCVVLSELNQRCHWAVRRKRFDAQSTALRAVLHEAGLGGWYVTSFPVAVTLTHVGRRMDTDNLAGAFKGVRDSLAAWLGVDDGDEASVTWHYRQETGRPGGVRVRIQGR